jgi:AraC family transcriptional regulator, regulatory protein of adaptative response / DNA-3-methyladenine glycosylase II
VLVNADACYQAIQSRDSRFDGWFYVAVTSTRIYCRPSCPAGLPKRANVRFYPSAAAAQSAGFRACKRCRPDATPGSPEWDVRADLVGRAMRLIGDGVVDREGVSGLARRLGFSERHLHRQLVAEVGAGPIAVARAQRAQTARLLLETTDLAISDVAFAAGFASIRQFNDTVRDVFAVTPTELRRARRPDRTAAPGAITVRLPYRAPIDLPDLFGFLAARAVPGIEDGADQTYRRSLALPHGAAIVELASAPTGGPSRTGAARGTDRYVQCTLRLDDVRDLAVAVQRCRRLLDLDADPVAVAAALDADPLLGPLIAAAPGRRVPGHVDGAELAVRAVLGQQVSVGAARTLAARLVARHGRPLAAPAGVVTHLFPDPATLAAVDPAELARDVGMPAARARAVGTVSAALAGGDLVLDPGADRAEVRQRLLDLPGIGPWTAAYVAMRAIGDPDVFLPTDVGVRHALTRLGADPDPRAAATLADRWRPWRSYALLHLWGSLTPTGRI